MSRSGAGQGHGSQRCSTRSFNSGGSSAARRRRVGGAGQDPAHRGAATEAGCGRFRWRGERTGARSYHHQGPRISFEFHDQSILFTSADGAVSSTTSGREHLTCRRPRLDVARRAHPWPGTWCIYRRSQYERYPLAVTSDGKVVPRGAASIECVQSAERTNKKNLRKPGVSFRAGSKETAPHKLTR